MSSKHVIDTVAAYLAAQWTETRIIDAMNLFSSIDADPGGPLVEWVTFVPEDSVEMQASIGFPGNQRWREEGAISFTAFVPSGTGVDRALELSELLRDMVRAKQIGVTTDTVSAITFREVSPPDTALPSSVDASSGNWYG